MTKTQNTALLSALRALTPANVMRSSLTFSTGFIAHEILLLLAFRTDHGLRSVSGESHLLALLTQVSHAMGAVWCAHTTAFTMVTFRALWVPENAPLIAVFALLLGAPTTPKCLGLLTERPTAFELRWTIAPTIFNDTFVSVLADWVAQVIGLVVTMTALTDHLTDISEPGFQPTRILSFDHLLWNFGWVHCRLMRLDAWMWHRFLRGNGLFYDTHLVTEFFFNCLMRFRRGLL